MEKENGIFDKNDDFWDIESMLPKRKTPTAFSSDTSAVDIGIKADEEKAKGGEELPNKDRIALAKEALKMAEEKHLRFASASFGDRSFAKDQEFEAVGQADEPLTVYAPESNPLIKEIKVCLWPSRYSFYSQFRNDAIKLYGKEGKPCPHVHFFSYTPQYSQLNRDQTDFYLYFRSMIRQGNAIKADYSYILLLIYEIINIPDILPPEEGIKLLNLIWLSYRKEHPKLDRHLSEWVCDYCLIHRIEAPGLHPSLCDYGALASALKEFYVGLNRIDDGKASPYASALFAYAPSYNYRTGKFINDENRELFDTHIKNAFIYAFTKAEKEKLTVFVPIGSSSMTDKKAVRDAFGGALCAYSIKRQIYVSYLSCSRSPEVRYTVTDAVKYAENQVRAMLGIRSRFHTPNLAQPLKTAIDEYFAPLKKELKKEQMAKEEVPEYDVLYEPIKSDFSIGYAKDIEKKAWHTTELLVDEEELFEEAPIPEAKAEEMSLEGDMIKEALTILLNSGSEAFEAYSREQNMLPDAMCEAINDKMYDTVGDTVIESTDNGFEIIPDYLEEIKEWTKK